MSKSLKIALVVVTTFCIMVICNKVYGTDYIVVEGNYSQYEILEAIPEMVYVDKNESEYNGFLEPENGYNEVKDEIYEKIKEELDKKGIHTKYEESSEDNNFVQLEVGLYRVKNLSVYVSEVKYENGIKKRNYLGKKDISLTYKNSDKYDLEHQKKIDKLLSSLGFEKNSVGIFEINITESYDYNYFSSSVVHESIFNKLESENIVSKEDGGAGGGGFYFENYGEILYNMYKDDVYYGSYIISSRYQATIKVPYEYQENDETINAYITEKLEEFLDKNNIPHNSVKLKKLADDYYYVGDNIDDDVFGRILVLKEEFMLGDLDGNGKVEINDAIMILKHITGKSKLVNDRIKVADVTKDEKVNIDDAIKILRYIVGKDKQL